MQDRGASRNYTTEKEKRKRHRPVPQSEWQNIQNASSPEGGGIDRTKIKRTLKTDSPVPQFSGPRTQTPTRHSTGGGAAGRKHAGKTLNPAQNFESVSLSTRGRLDYPDRPRHLAGGSAGRKKKKPQTLTLKRIKHQKQHNNKNPDLKTQKNGKLST